MVEQPNREHVLRNCPSRGTSTKFGCEKKLTTRCKDRVNVWTRFCRTRLAFRPLSNQRMGTKGIGIRVTRIEFLEMNSHSSIVERLVIVPFLSRCGHE